MRTSGLILVVDDDWMNREVVQAYLENAGYTVMVAHSGNQALELAAARPPDLILLDVRMQGMNGYEVCARFKAHEATRLTPILIITALDSDEDKRKAIDAGADDFIFKPISSLLLLLRVKNLLQLKRLRHELDECRRKLREAPDAH